MFAIKYFPALYHDELYFENGDMLKHRLFLGKICKIVLQSNVVWILYNQTFHHYHNIPLLNIFFEVFPLLHIVLLCYYDVLFLIQIFRLRHALYLNHLIIFALCPLFLLRLFPLSEYGFLIQLYQIHHYLNHHLLYNRLFVYL